MRKRPFLLAMIAWTTLFLLPSPAGAAGTVSITSATVSGTTLLATGGSTYTDQPFVLLGTDAAGDATHMDAQGGDVVAASMATTAGGGAQLRWTLNSLPPQINGSPAVMYGWDFCVNDESCFEMNLQRFTFVTPSTNPHAVLWRCADPSCDPGGQTRAQTGGMTITFDGAARTVTVTLPAVAGATAGSVISPVTQDSNGPAFTTPGTADPFTGLYDQGDGAASLDAYTVPAKQVSVAIGNRGLDPATVPYTTTVTPAANGSWNAALSVAGTSGELAVYARACLGANNCAYASTDITI